MSYRHTLEAALESLREIEGLITGFPHGKDIPAIEIDLTLQKTRNLYDLLLMMRKSKEEPATATEAAATKVVEIVTETLLEKEVPTISRMEEPASVPVVKTTKGPKDVKTLADQYAGRPTLHESLHKSVSGEYETLGHARPVSNLMEAIGINDRFTFVRELFNGDHASYETALGALNQASSFNDAYNYMIQQFNWDMDSEAVQILLDIIRRKFIKGRHE